MLSPKKSKNQNIIRLLIPPILAVAILIICIYLLVKGSEVAPSLYTIF